MARLEDEPNVSARRALLLSLGSYEEQTVSDQDRQALLDHCTALYASDPDAGIHSACEWLLRRWGKSTTMPDASSPLTDSRSAATDWCIELEGHTLAVIDGRAIATMGSPSTEDNRSIAEKAIR